MRRNNEVMHQENIAKIIEELKPVIQDSDTIFVHAPGPNKHILFDQGGSLFDFKKDVVSIGVTSKKANYSEVLRLFEEVTKVYIVSENNLN